MFLMPLLLNDLETLGLHLTYFYYFFGIGNFIPVHKTATIILGEVFEMHLYDIYNMQ